jgi:predicted dienelactone hydrolase
MRLRGSPVRLLAFVLALLVIGPASTALGDPPAFRAGIARITVAADVPFDVLVWYPTPAEEVPWQVGPFPIPASRDAPVAPGTFPIVLLSHGGGDTGGTPLVLRELSVSLARHGFVVVAPFHGNRPRSLAVRPVQIDRALEDVLADPRFREHADPTRMGMVGFSLGGAVTLVRAGAVPDEAHLAAYCAAHIDDPMACGSGPGGGTSREPASTSAAPTVRSAPPRIRLKAIVLLDPLGAIFSRDSLVTVDMPVLLYRAEQSRLKAEGNALALAAALPRPPRQEVVPGGHFAFIDSCPESLRAELADACEDPPGVDRAAIHARVEAEVSAFFRDAL